MKGNLQNVVVTTFSVVILIVMAWLTSTLILKPYVKAVETKLNEQKEKIQQLEQQNKDLQLQVIESTRGAYLRRYFQDKRSPIVTYANTIIDVGRRYNISPDLLAAVSMAESGGCKRYIKSTNNCFGWGGGRLAFTDIGEGINVVGRSVSTKTAYRLFQGNPTVRNFAKSYNHPYWADYEKKLSYFIQEIEEYK